VVVRYNADGSLDNSFGGKRIIDFGFGPGSSGANAVVVQPDGKIVVVGGSHGLCAVARLLPDGSPDMSFDGDGLRTFAFGPDSSGANAVVVQPNGKIVLAGAVRGSVPGGWFDFAVARLDTDGSLDNNFDSDGIQTIHFTGSIAEGGGVGSGATTLALQSDGKIVVAGDTEYPVGEGSKVAAVARLNPNGSLDTDFGSGGKLPLSFPAGGMALQSDGKIVLAGWTAESTSTVARLNPNGSLDTDFGSGGTQTINLIVGRVAMQSDGKIVVAGASHPGTTAFSDVAVGRLNSTGSLDTTFGTAGRVTTDFGPTNGAAGLAVQSDGKIVVVGSSGQPTTFQDFAVARYIGAAEPADGNGDGIPDSQQSNVTSLPNSGNGSYVTLASPTGTTLDAVAAVSNPSPNDAPAGVTFPVGFLDFSVVGVTPGGATTVVLYLPNNLTVATYWKYGPTPDNLTPHWYEFLDQTVNGRRTGAVIDNVNHTITLYFVDGERGDNDVNGTDFGINGVIVDPGAPALKRLSVQIDIKPGSYPNTINLGSNGTVPVAIFSTATFNAATVDPSTVTLAGAAVRLRGNGTPQASLQDVNGDGRLDLVVHVVTEALELTAGDVQAALTGRTTDGFWIEGNDSVRVINGLHAPEGGPGSAVTLLAPAEAEAMFWPALARWSTLGSPSLLNFAVVVDDLPCDLLGTAAGNVITLDADAAGWGWFIDPTPTDDSEFTMPGDQGEAGRIDLLSVLMHELGHVLGLDHSDADHDLMAVTLPTGVRRVPALDNPVEHVLPETGSPLGVKPGASIESVALALALPAAPSDGLLSSANTPETVWPGEPGLLLGEVSLLPLLTEKEDMLAAILGASRKPFGDPVLDDLLYRKEFDLGDAL
jgi:uncharacterized delta-60 repeat protein